MKDKNKTEENERDGSDSPISSGRQILYPESPFDAIQQAVRIIEEEAYKRGLREGAKRLEFWSCVVPGSISKKALLESLKKEAHALYDRC